jgi:phage tail protein X
LARRVSLPTADDLFRATSAGEARDHEGGERPRRRSPVRAVDDRDAQREAEELAARKPSGRVRHDEKMTVYVTSGELHDIEHARLTLRAGHGLAVDRGRLVREAVAIVLADFEAHGEDSVIVQRLNQA